MELYHRAEAAGRMMRLFRLGPSVWLAMAGEERSTEFGQSRLRIFACHLDVILRRRVGATTLEAAGYNFPRCK